MFAAVQFLHSGGFSAILSIQAIQIISENIK